MVNTFLNLNKIKIKLTKLTQIKGKTFKYICHVIDHFSGYNIIWAHLSIFLVNAQKQNVKTTGKANWF